ncbi:MAG: aminotransferase class V-fold PLP-dependent enzyme [Chitinophagales bacterium]
MLSASLLPELVYSEHLKTELIRVKRLSPNEVATDEDFWATIKEAYTASATIINLNNGGVSPSPKVVQDALDRFNKMSNEAPSYYMWQILDKGRESLRKKIAELAGCDAEEIAINRNTTEALDNVIFGLDFKKGDEVILTKQDYPNMINAWKQREKRDGIILKWVELELPTDDTDYLVKKYTEQITSQTKLVQVNHIINWTGHINPVRKIADAVHTKGAEVMIDGAHTFGHFVFKIPELGGDYYGTSLHKWLSSSIGSGVLWIKKEKIKKVWPLMGAPDTQEVTNIRKFENLGTRSFPIEYSIANAIDFHRMIGAERKEARLRFLKDYWTSKIENHPKIHFNTSFNPAFSCAIANFSVDGMKPDDVATKLFTEHSVHCVAINWENIQGVRVAPHVYTSLSDLDRLVDGIKKIVSA